MHMVIIFNNKREGNGQSQVFTLSYKPLDWHFALCSQNSSAKTYSRQKHLSHYKKKK